jgi:hypothetical protein
MSAAKDILKILAAGILSLTFVAYGFVLYVFVGGSFKGIVISHGLIKPQYHTTLYGWETITGDTFGMVFVILFVIPSAIYQGIYLIAKSKAGNKRFLKKAKVTALITVACVGISAALITIADARAQRQEQHIFAQSTEVINEYLREQFGDSAFEEMEIVSVHTTGDIFAEKNHIRSAVLRVMVYTPLLGRSFELTVKTYDYEISDDFPPNRRGR